MKVFNNKTKRINEVRQRLREAPDGMTVAQILAVVDTERTHLSRILNGMVDAYIDRWEKSVADKRWLRAVWCVVVAPENCPRPNPIKEKKKCKK